MRAIAAAAIAILSLTACEAKTDLATPTAEELGQDDPSVPFVPAPVGPPKKYDATSKTAMAFTPAGLTATPTPQQSPNLPSGMTFTFPGAMTIKTTLVPGGASEGNPPFDFKPFFIDASGAAIDPEKIAMYSVDEETVQPAAPNAGFCGNDKLSFLATYTVTSPGAEDMTILALKGDSWPPKDASVVCGTFTYSIVH
jgi:hypothetical protein